MLQDVWTVRKKIYNQPVEKIPQPIFTDPESYFTFTQTLRNTAVKTIRHYAGFAFAHRTKQRQCVICITGAKEA